MSFQRIRSIMKLNNSRIWIRQNVAFYSNNTSARSVLMIPQNNITVPKLFAISRRIFSDSTNIDKLVVDFEHVKKATSNKDIFIIDVREPEEIKEYGMIPNSINIPLGNVSSALSTMPEKEFVKKFSRSKPTDNTEIIFYCMIGKRSGMAQQNALNLGYKNAKNYLGSWTEWASKNQ